MTRWVSSIVLTCLLAFACNRTSAEAQEKPAAPEAAKAEKETRYLAFQIFTYGPNPLIATMGEGTHPQPARFPEKAAFRDYIEDIKGRIGAVGDPQTRLAVMLGHLSFDHGDAETTKFIGLGFELALETDVAVGFHIDDSMFWAGRKNLWSDPNNVEALDWDGTPCTGRILNWGKEPSAAPPQMCFNSKAVQREVRQRAVLIGKAIQAGVNRLQQLKRPELFAGVIAGSETQIGQDFKTGKYLGYRALLNRGFSREHPPQDMDLEREKIVQKFIELWATGLADAGVSPQKIYSHICFLSRRAFSGDDRDITYMKHKGEMSYSQHNHFTPPSVAFGKDHRPGFSTYPQPGLFDDIYEQLARHNQIGWASCEGTNMQPESGPGQSGMNMETYLAKMFNHGATLTTIFSWGIGGPAIRDTNPFRIVTEGQEALQAYRKFLKGDALIEAKTVASLTERLPPKIHQIQRELPAWIQKTGNTEAAALMQKLDAQLKAKNFDAVEKTADSILKMMGVSVPAAAQDGDNKPQQTQPSIAPSDDTAKRLTEKVERVKAGAQKWTAGGRDPSVIAKAMQEKFKPLIEAGKVVEAEAELDRVLEQLNQDAKNAESPTVPTQAAHSSANPAKASKAESEALKPDKFGIVGGFGLLTQKSVQEELKLSDDQMKKFEVVQAKLRESYQELRDLDQKERARMLAKLSVDGERAITETLKPEQIKRFKEISLQQDGPLLSVEAKDGEVAAAWKLTDDQKQKIKTIGKEMGTAMREASKAAGGDRGKMVARMQELLKSGNEKLMGLLTEEQKTKWKELIGEPFKGELNSPQAGPRTFGANDANDIEYLVFMPPLPGAGSTPDSFTQSILAFSAKLGTTGDGKIRQLGFGFGIPFFVSNESDIRKAIKQGFDFAKQTNVAVHFLVDDHAKWDERPDLWNWYDPAKKGYNPDNRKNVEWYDWEGTPSKRRYLSPDGVPRQSPHMCYNSPAILKEISRIMSQHVGPALREEINELKREHKEYLFAGITVGAEAGFDDYSVVPTVSQILSQPPNNDPMHTQMLKMLMMAAKLMEEDKAPHSRVGYCSLTNAGYSKINPPADINAALAAVNHQFIEFWDKQFFDAGVPRSRIYTHVAACARQDDSNNAPIGIVFNSYARPGWTTYPQSALKNGFKPLYDELAKHGNPTWGGVEANAFGNPNSPARASWEKYLAWHYNHGARLVGINVGASDQWVMSYLSKGAFGGEAMAAYKKFLKGEQLIENAEPPDDPALAMQRRVAAKVERVQEGAQQWAARGRDPSSIAKTMDEKVKPLLHAGKFIEAEAEVDRVLQQLNKDAK